MDNNKDIYLCSFASPDLSRSVLRFKKQANEMKVYKDIKIYSFDDLSENKRIQIENFKKKNKIDFLDMLVGNQK